MNLPLTMPRIFKRLGTVFLIVGAFSFIKLKAAGTTNTTPLINIAAKYPGVGANQIVISNLQVVTDTEEKERNEFKSQIRAWAINGDFEKLGSMAEDFRSHKSRFRNGEWKLRVFYIAFGDYKSIGDDKNYLSLIGQLERWAAEQTNSITPRLALVEAYHGYAWLARGGGWANQVTDQGEKLMEERKGKGLTWLRAAQKIQKRENDPAFYAIALHVFLGANVDRKTYEKFFESGVQNSPDYYALYEYKAYYLFPRWYGEDGEWEAFVRKTTERNDIVGSDEIFARVSIYLRDMGYFYDEFSRADDAWGELKSSFQALERNYPDSIEVKSIFCRMCLELRDYKEAREQFKLLNGKVDFNVWHTKEAFLQAVGLINNCDAYLEYWKKMAKTKQP